jgi:hypothetical protein
MSRSGDAGWVRSVSFLACALAGAALLLQSTTAGAQPPEGAASNPARTEVVSLRSEFAKVFRNTDGTLTAEISTRPLHYEKPDGAWAPADPTLVATSADGYSWRNAGGPLEFKFGQVASERMASVETDAGAISFGLADIAFASLGLTEGSRISYANVLPGVDLVYESREDALKELIILREAPKEAVSFRFALDLVGLTPRRERDGAISLLGRDGGVELFIPAASMTDARIDPQSAEPAFSEDVAMELVEKGGEYELTVTPNLAWLQDPKRVYPVEIDPTLTKSPSLDTFVQTGITSGQSGSDELKSGTFDSGSTKARSFVKFDLTGLMGKEILSATFSLQEFHSWSCTASQVNASRVEETWGSGVNWANQPTAAPAFDTLNVAKGFSGSCPAGRINFDAQAPVENWTSGNETNYGIRVRANDETANNGWKKFRSEEFDAGTSTDPKLEVTYNSYPTAVTSCSPAANTISTDTTPTVSCVYNDPDAGDVGHVDYQICSNSTCSAVVLSGEGTLGVDPGDPSPWTLSGTGGQILTSGQAYWWRARSDDGRPTKGPWSSTRQYAPNQSPAVPTDLDPPSALYTELMPTFSATYSDPDGKPGWVQFKVCEDAGCSGGSVVEHLDGSPVGSGSLSAWTVPDETLDGGRTYYWSAQSYDQISTSGWSAPVAYTLNEPPVVPTSPWPADGAHPPSTSPTLWADYDDPDDGDLGHIEFQLETSDGVLIESGSSSQVGPGDRASFAPVTALELEHTYRWRARSNDGAEVSAWSDFFEFHSSERPVTPFALNPWARVVTTVRPTLSAMYVDPDGIAGRVYFELLDAATSTVVASGHGNYVHSGARSSWAVPTDLDDGHLYVWRARGEDGSTSSVFSSDREFLVMLDEDLVHAWSYTGDPSSGGELIAEEWTRLNTTSARHEDEDGLYVRGPIACPPLLTSQCVLVQGVDEGDPEFRTYTSTISWEDDPELDEVATILGIAMADHPEPAGTGSTSILAPWQQPPVLHSNVFERYEFSDGSILVEQWLDSRTRLPLKERIYESGVLAEETYWTYDPAPQGPPPFPGDPFQLDEPVDVSFRQETVTSQAKLEGTVVDQDTALNFRPAYLGDEVTVAAPGGPTALCFSRTTVVNEWSDMPWPEGDLGDPELLPDATSEESTYVFADYTLKQDETPCEAGFGAAASALSLMSIARESALGISAWEAHVDMAEVIETDATDQAHGRAGVAALSPPGGGSAYIVPVDEATTSSVALFGVETPSVDRTVVAITGPLAKSNISAALAQLEGL